MVEERTSNGFNKFHNYAYAIFIKILILLDVHARGRKSGSAFNVCR